MEFHYSLGILKCNLTIISIIAKSHGPKWAVLIVRRELSS